MSEEQETVRTPTPVELADFCERAVYERKGEDIVRLDMSAFDWAQADQYVLCTGISVPHIGALAERIQREVRREYSLRPVKVDGTPQSQWIILDFALIVVHVMTHEAREKFQLEELWNDAPRIDVIRRLDEEYKKRAAKRGE